MRKIVVPAGTKMGLAASLVTALGVGTFYLFNASFLFGLAKFGTFYALFFAVAASSILTFFCTLLLSRYFFDRPLWELIRQVRRASARDFLIRVPVGAHDVIGELAKSYNQLLERITTLDVFNMENRRLLVAQEELSLLHEFSKRLSSTLEPDELCHVVEHFLGEDLKFSEFALLLYEEKETRAVVRVVRGFFDTSKVVGMEFRPEEGLTGKVLTTGEMIYVSDTRVQPNYLHYKGEKKEDGAFLSLPLVVKKKVVGVLNLFRPVADSFSANEIQFLKTLAMELAMAVMNAQLYACTRELAIRDELTQLYNRRHFQKMLPLEVKRSERFGNPLSLLMMDIDHFKKLNDMYGHLIGDQFLMEFVKVVGAHVRDVDFFARFGGEEFTLLLPNTSRENALKVAEKICTLIREHHFTVGDLNETERITVSIGVASYPADGQNGESLMNAADTALYAAKKQGRDRIVSGSSNLQESHHLL